MATGPDSAWRPVRTVHGNRSGRRRETPPVGPGGENVGVELERLAWLVTVLACLVTAVILLLEGYYGYAGVTFAVAVSAFINLF